MIPALALLLGSLHGDPTDPPHPSTGHADGGWEELDARLGKVLAAGEGGALRWGALVRAFASHAGTEANGAEKISGFVLEDVDVHFAVDGERLSWRVSMDLDGAALADAGEEVQLEDAHARFVPAAGWELVVGRFKPRVARSASIVPEGLLFRDRTFLGATFDLWDAGLELGRHYDQFDFWFALANAEDGLGTEDFWSLRVEWALYDSPFEDVEGARGAPNHLRALLGGFVFDDTALASSKAGGVGFDLAFQLGPWAFLAEWASLGSAFVRDVDVRDGAVVTIGDGHPWALSMSRRCGDWESGVRVERAGDAERTRALGLVTSWGRASARWSLEADRVRDDLGEDTRLSLGVQMGSSGLSRPLGDADPFGATLPIGGR
jgi:hypothetical protein